ncbi:hypothetical protein B4064_2427 [Caldibacillus thermoamylovorans]|uniref:Uncharacterized protein n=1 Tax=Caldibacillus thermoamylovorans TaxID=35841 RepID=A0A0D0FMK0_9BACI|nr:hypothetical protein B4065_3029 [Caldibacillus thermoamylovorans]KIO63501.1 hypothetical protein B4166_3015 [Caldibacillus thermoamylovorans]KIO65858.1 hypothetical protein B4064_2427 [Caldibacillus thermoamylovorans]KIO72861.1 hypothetical protein B4167_2637 [Caldibacillus thermoamylovorans]
MLNSLYKPDVLLFFFTTPFGTYKLSIGLFPSVVKIACSPV